MTPDFTDAMRRALVADVFLRFGEEAAHQVAGTLGIRFEDCAAEIDRMRRLPEPQRRILPAP